MLKIRHNSNIRYVIIQHTGHIDPVTSEDVNNEYLQNGDYGAPYDILIDKNGFTSLTPRWTRNPDKNKIDVNSDINKIFRYKNHFYSDILPSMYQDSCINIGVIGNYDIERPNTLIFNTLVKILTKTVNTLNIDLYVNLLYYSEIVVNTSPGVFFFDKPSLLKMVKKEKERVFIPRLIFPDGGGVEPEVPEEEKSYRLLEDGSKRLLENGSKRLLEEII